MLRIEDELKNNQISRFQLLYGEERYMVQYYRNQLIEKLSNPDDEMNRTFFRDKPEPSQIAEAAQILPFFAERTRRSQQKRRMRTAPESALQPEKVPFS